jgi:predicted nuclease of predicted toxin-antitoxin system
VPERPVVLVDQNVSRNVSAWLAAARPAWAVHHAFDLGLARATDPELAAWATANEAIVLTFDEDFADHRSAFASRLIGVIRLRVWPTTDEEAIGALGRLLVQVEEDQLAGSLIVVSQASIRVRPWPPTDGSLAGRRD